LSEDEIGAFHTLARELAMDALVEVHDEHDVELALAVGAELIGVNQRDLKTFEVDPQRAARLAGSIPPEVVSIAESGIGGPEEARALATAGFQAVLVGESLLRAQNRREAVSALDGHEIGHRSSFAPPGRAGD
jgi:indole-3-glycerol phosphate synthase